MADLRPGAIKLLPLLGPIQEGAAAHLDTAELWASIRDAAAAEGYDISGAGATDLNQLRAWASGNVYAAEAVQRAGPGRSLDSSMIGRELYAGEGVIEGRQQLYNIRFEHTVIENGVELQLWRTSQISGLLPPTIDDLEAMMEGDAESLADEYNQSHVSIGSISIRVGA